MQGHVFGDGDDEGDFGGYGFEDGGCGVRGGDEDGGRGGFCGEGGDGLSDCGVGGEVGEGWVRVGCLGFEGGGDAAEDLGAVG